MLNSLRARLMAGTIIGTLLVYLAAATVLYSAIRASLLSEFDAALEAKAQAIMSLTEQTERGVRFEFGTRHDELGAREPDDGYVVISAEGRTIAHADPRGGGQWWNAIVKVEGAGNAKEHFGFMTLPSGDRCRYVTARFMPRWDDRDRMPPPRRAMVQLAALADSTELGEKLSRLSWLIAGAFGLSTVVSAAVLALVIQRGMRPLRLLAAGIQRIGNGNLSGRIDIGRPPQEIQPVVQRLNELLARLDASFARERGFTADVAHELRTPLAGLTTALEVSAMRPREQAEYQETVKQCLAASRSMRGLVENLLTLARADAREISAGRQPVDLAALVRQTWPTFERRAAARSLVVNLSLDNGVVLESDGGLVGTVLSNLFDNAVTYTNDGGRIEIKVSSEATNPTLRVVNTGSEVAAEDAGKVFDRFWRGDAARSLVGSHFGLGLALCQRIVTLLGGRITVASAKQGEFAVTVAFTGDPALPPSGP
ncbi:MAG: ATP-binding protein [Tepidisphaeraceae bacterium]